MRGACLCEELRTNQLNLVNNLINNRIDQLQQQLMHYHFNPVNGVLLNDRQIMQLEANCNQVTDEYAQLIHVQTVIRSMIENQDGIN